MSFEVVYQPKEIRVYIYGPFPQPANGKDVKGEISLQPRNDKRATRLALRHVAPPESEQDYLSVPADLSRVKDGELTATIKLENVPLPQHPTATFTQAVVMSKAQLQVTLAALDQSDRALIARQRVCPVTGAELGGMGGPIKVLVGGRPLYLCCKGCLGKVQSAPEAYLRKASPAGQKCNNVSFEIHYFDQFKFPLRLRAEGELEVTTDGWSTQYPVPTSSGCQRDHGVAPTWVPRRGLLPRNR